MQDLSQCKILLVDDTKTNIDVLVQALKDDYKLGVAVNGKSALAQVSARPPDLILLDIMMPEMDGYEVCAKLKGDSATEDIPVVFLTAMNEVENKTKGFEVGAVDYITKPFQIAEVKARVQTHLSLKMAKEQLKNQNEILEHKVQERTKEIEETQRETIFRLGLAAEYRDTDTGMHIQRIRWYTHMLAGKLGYSNREAELMGLASTMHDIGKIGIPDRILLKPGKLEREEWEIMKGHSQIGADILAKSKSGFLESAAEIALAHHERWDGKGYPNGIGGEDIPLEGRIVCIVDVFDALTSKRPYKEPWPVEKALEVIDKDKGAHFDPKLADLFLACEAEVREIHGKYQDAEEEALIDAFVKGAACTC